MFDSMFIIFTQLRSTYDYESHKNHRRSLQGDDEDRLRWNFPQSGQPNPVAGTYVPERIMPFDDVIFGNCSNSAFIAPPPPKKNKSIRSPWKPPHHHHPGWGGRRRRYASHSAPEDFLRPPNTLDIFLPNPLDFEPVRSLPLALGGTSAAPAGIGPEPALPPGAASDAALAPGLLKWDDAAPFAEEAGGPAAGGVGPSAKLLAHLADFEAST